VYVIVGDGETDTVGEADGDGEGDGEVDGEVDGDTDCPVGDAVGDGEPENVGEPPETLSTKFISLKISLKSCPFFVNLVMIGDH
jgi:hypothetical protein